MGFHRQSGLKKRSNDGSKSKVDGLYLCPSYPFGPHVEDGTSLRGPRRNNLAKIPSILIAQSQQLTWLCFEPSITAVPDRPVGLLSIVTKSSDGLYLVSQEMFSMLCTQKVLGRWAR
jgi:hypothetical protein